MLKYLIILPIGLPNKLIAFATGWPIKKTLSELLAIRLQQAEKEM